MQDNAYTFLGNSKAGATLFMDIAVFEDDEMAKRHALQLLKDHDSGEAVEVWRSSLLIAKIPRAAISGPAAEGG
ncbi:hypothetical protein [Caulobacter sp. RHG1]|uniref:hypothetical protein n=1 Tax=Caulobacter sp. (strain RHG1) TaxID=2545762 RepID=UPI00155717A0|nr:hypothetical protein [Caulobacter sp. RHG1]